MVLDGLEPPRGGSRNRVAYEVALEGTGQAIGHYAALIATEEARARPDAGSIEQWRAAQHGWATRRRALRLDSTAEFAAICSEGEDLLAEPDHDSEHREPELTEDDNERMLRERIVPDEFTTTSHPEPVAVIVAGQPGDGKAAVVALARDVLVAEGRDPVLIGPERYQPYWPVSRVPIGAGPAGYLGSDGPRWTAKGLATAREQRADIVLETPLLAPDDVQRPARALKAAGYRVELALLAVPGAVSWLGVLEGHLRALEVFGFGRLADPDLHDGAYRRLLEVAVSSERDPYVDQVAVVRSDGRVIHEGAAGAAEAIQQERNRRWSAEQSREFLQGIAELRRISRSAPIEWIADEAARGAAMLSSLAGRCLHPDAVTLQIATEGVLPPDA